jgi:transposase
VRRTIDIAVEDMTRRWYDAEGFPSAELVCVMHMRANGTPVRRIAQRFSVSTGTIYTLLRANERHTWREFERRQRLSALRNVDLSEIARE